MDSHDLQRHLSGMIMDQSLRYDELQHLAGLPDYDSDVEVEGTMVVGQPYDLSESDEEEQTHLFQQRHTAHVDRFDGAFTHAEKLSIKLLAIMRRIGAPNAAYGEIMAITSDALLHSAFLSSTFLDRGQSLTHFAQRFSMQPLFPTVERISSPENGRQYPLVIHRAKAMVESLLNSALMEDDNNLLFPDLTNPLAPPPTVVTTLADIDTGRIYRRAYDLLCHGRPNHVLCGIILYIDKLAVDRHGHLSLEPVYFTLSIFNQKTRNKPQAWRPLGYIPNIGLMSKAESRHGMSSDQKVQFYHDILERILESLVDLQQADPMHFPLLYRGQQYKLKLKFPLLAVLGDTESHDRLCARYNNRNVNVKRLCRHCDTPNHATATVDFPWSHILPDEISGLLATGDLAGLKNISQHPVRNAFYNGVCLGGNQRSIHGMTPAEPLHLLELGLFKYAVEGFCVALGYVPTSKSPPKILKAIDGWARIIGRYLGHQSDRGLPRTYFPNGVTGGTKLAGHEMNGVLLVLLILCKVDSSKALICTKLTDVQLKGWVKLFESLLTWRWWLKRPTLPMHEVTASEPCTKELLKLFKAVVNRQHGAGMLFIKFHICLHFFENNLDLGVTSNFDTGPMESNHKINAKNPSKRTQMRAEGFEEGTAHRYIEDLVIDVASHELSRVLPVISKDCSNPSALVSLLQGAKYTIAFGDVTPDNLRAANFTLTWDKRHVVATGYDCKQMEWLANHLLVDLGALATVRGCTEHTRENTRGGRYIFRAHPAFRGGESWHDWALFQWTTDSDNVQLIPGHIVTFIELDEFHLEMLQDNENVIATEPGLYAMIESLEEPLTPGDRYSRIVVHASKNVTAAQSTLRRNAGIPLARSNTFLVPVDTLYEPIAAVPNVGGEVGDYCFIRPADDWGFEFTKLLHAYLPEEQLETP